MKKVKQMETEWKYNDSHGDVFSIRAPDTKGVIACANSNGEIELRSYTTGRLSYTMVHSGASEIVTALRFNPKDPSLLFACSTDGKITGYKMAKTPKESWTVKEEENETYALDMSPDGLTFATGGRDRKVRLYSIPGTKVLTTFDEVGSTQQAAIEHTNRVYSVLFVPNNPSIVLSGGWDDTIIAHDVRMKQSIHSMAGAHICGDAMDTNGTTIVTGSWRTSTQLQLWDMRTWSLIKENSIQREPILLPYSLKIHPDGSTIYAGGSGSNEVIAFDANTLEIVGSPIAFEHSLFSLSLVPDSSGLYVGTSEGTVAKLLFT